MKKMFRIRWTKAFCILSFCGIVLGSCNENSSIGRGFRYFQQSLLTAQLTQVSDRFEQVQAVINLYQALGGGR